MDLRELSKSFINQWNEQTGWNDEKKRIYNEYQKELSKQKSPTLRKLLTEQYNDRINNSSFGRSMGALGSSVMLSPAAFGTGATTLAGGLAAPVAAGLMTGSWLDATYNNPLHKTGEKLGSALYNLFNK